MNKPRITPSQEEVTVLIHGIWMQGFMMSVMSKRLETLGFRTVAYSYDFLNNSPVENAHDLYRRIGELGARRVNLVGHSLGGIVILHLLDQFPELAVGRIVLIGSPVNGSYVARRVHDNRMLRPLLGRSIASGGLLDGAPRYQGDRPLGIITGSGQMGLAALLFPAGANSDGVVRDSETMIENATDRVRVRRSHSAMIFSGKCADYVANFLNVGRFRL